MKRNPAAMLLVAVALACTPPEAPVQSTASPPTPEPQQPVEVETLPLPQGEFAVRVGELQWPSASENMLINPSFEEERGWSLVGEHNLVDLNGGDPADGARCVTFTSSSRPRDLVGLRSAPVLLDSDEPVYFTGLFRVEGGLADDSNSATVRTGTVIQWLSESGSVIDEIYALILNGSYQNWRRMTRRLVPPPGAAALQLIIASRCETAGAPPTTVSVDDFAIYCESDVRHEVVGSTDSAVESPHASISVATSDDGPMTRLDLTASAIGDAGVGVIVEVWTERTGGEWRWHPDLIRSELMEREERHAWTVSADQSGDLPLSVFPAAAITSDGETIGVATNPTAVSVHELFAERGGVVRVGAAFHLGVVPGREEHVSLWFLSESDGNGARGVFTALRDAHPEMFYPRGEERRITRCGIWNAGRPIPHAEDFGSTFITSEQLDNPNDVGRVIAHFDSLDALLMQYIIPWADEPTVAAGGDPLPALEECLAIEADGAGEEGSRRQLRIAGSQSLLRETNGDPMVARIFKPTWRNGAWTLALPLDLSLDITEGRGAATLDLIRLARENADEHQHDRFPVQMDNFLMDTPHVMTDEAHILACEGPLTYSPNTLEPAAPLAENHVRWLAALGEEVGPEGILSANALRSGVARFGIPYLDVVSFEGHASPLPERAENWSLEELAWRRALAGTRPVAAVLSTSPPGPDGGSAAAMGSYAEEVWHRCLAFGVVPSIKEMWSSAAITEAMRPTYARFLPVVARMSDAGWQPMPLATWGDADMIVERFGSGEVTLLSIHNLAASEQSATIVPDWQALGLEAPGVVEELVSSEMLTVDDGAFTVSLASERTAVVLLRPAE